MLKKKLKTVILTSVITILPMFAGLVMWNKLPEKIPTHWGLSGEVDGWSGKPFAVFFIALVIKFVITCSISPASKVFITGFSLSFVISVIS